MNLLHCKGNKKFVLTEAGWEHPDKPGAVTSKIKTVEQGLAVISEMITLLYVEDGQREFKIRIEV